MAENKDERPACFEFAMEFLGAPEEAQVRAYVAGLELRSAAAQSRINALLEEVEGLRAAAKTYAERYCVDEADDDWEYTGCSQQQHEDAKALFAAIDSSLSGGEGGGN